MSPFDGPVLAPGLRFGGGDQFKHLQHSPQVAARPKMELLLMPRLDFRDNTDLKEKRDESSATNAMTRSQFQRVLIFSLWAVV